jgi:hypothetical protein
MRGSSWRRLPAAALRGLTKVFSPLSRAISFSRSKSRRNISTSPRTSSHLGRMPAGQAHRDGADGAQVGADIFAAETIAARRAAHETAILIVQRHRQSIEFRLDRIFDGVDSVRSNPSRTRRSKASTSDSEKALPSDSMGMACGLQRSFQRPGADSLGRRISAQQFGMGGLEILQFTQQAVVLGIRQGRRIEHVIAEVGLVDGARNACTRQRSGASPAAGHSSSNAGSPTVRRTGATSARHRPVCRALACADRRPPGGCDHGSGFLR